MAEAYRKSSELEKALKIAQKGVSYHPEFIAGHVALGQTLFDLSEYDRAAEHFSKAVKLSPENILAHTRLARCLLQLRSSKEALKAYKMVLFLNPNSSEATKAIQKLESLTADEFEDDELFSIKPLNSDLLGIHPRDENSKSAANLDRENRRLLRRKISLLDAFIVRSDIDRAQKVITELKTYFPESPEVLKREAMLSEKLEEDDDESYEMIQPLRRSQSLTEMKLQTLNHLLKRVENWKNFS